MLVEYKKALRSKVLEHRLLSIYPELTFNSTVTNHFSTLFCSILKKVLFNLWHLNTDLMNHLLFSFAECS